jgi:hypothetical protein
MALSESGRAVVVSNGEGEGEALMHADWYWEELLARRTEDGEPDLLICVSLLCCPPYRWLSEKEGLLLCLLFAWWIVGRGSLL